MYQAVCGIDENKQSFAKKKKGGKIIFLLIVLLPLQKLLNLFLGDFLSKT